MKVHESCRQKYFQKQYIKGAKRCKNSKLKNCRPVLQSQPDIIENGTTCILALYGAKESESDLNQYRYQCFKAAISKDSRVQLSNLPCTLDAATQHLKKVYLQVQLWIGNNITPAEYVDWGWKFDKFLTPNPMTQEPAPQNLLKIIFCKCKSGCGGNCGCRKTGLFCTEACFYCNTEQNCTNCAPILLQENNLLGSENDLDIV